MMLLLQIIAAAHAISYGQRVVTDADEVRVAAAFSELGGPVEWGKDVRRYLGGFGVVVEVGDGYLGVLHGDGAVVGWPEGVVHMRSQRAARELGHIVNAVEANHPPEFTLNPARPTVIMHEDQGELQNGDYWLCGVSDCNGDDQDLLFRFLNGNPQLPNPSPCLVNGGVPRVTPPAPDNDPTTYFTRGPLATRRLMNVAPIQNCPGGGTGVGCGGGGRQWPEDPATGARVPNTCAGIEEPSCYNTNDQGGACQGCTAAEAQGRYWCKWPSTLQTNPISPALPNLGGGPTCGGVPQRCPACVKVGMPPAATVDAASQCNVRCWDDTRSGGAHARLEAEPSEDHWGWVCWDVRAEDDGIPNVLQGSCNCQPGCSTRPCDESPTQRACIYIEPVNDCPTFKVKGDATILEDSATCNGSPDMAPACDPLAAGGGVVTSPGCLNNLGSCCCPTHANGCTLDDWIYDINQGGWNEHPYQSVYFDVTVDRPELFQDAASVPCVEYVPRTGQCGRTSDAAFNAADFVSRDVNFVLRPDACGKVTFTVTARDDGGESNDGCYISQPQSFVLEIKPVNDAPTFNPGPVNGDALTVDEDSGSWRYAGWATGISPGPGDCEKDQHLVFDIDCADKAVFAVQPVVDPVTGDLSFTPAQHAFTSTKAPSCVTCTVILKDDGGTSDGGSDASAATDICITVNSINDPPTYKPAGDVVVCEDTPYTAPWALDMCIGGARASPLCANNELLPPESQTFTFTLGPYDTSLFTPTGQPAVDANGVLTFTPAPGASGTTEVIVTLDDGGGGTSTYTDKLVVTVVDVNDPPTAVVGGTYDYTVQGVACGPAGGTALLGDAVVSGDLDTCRATCDTTVGCECFLMDAGGCRLRTGCVLADCATVAGSSTYFRAYPLIEVNEDTGMICSVDYLTGISPGVGDGSQMTTITVSATPQSLFATQPYVVRSADSADLCFTPAVDANGEAFVDITIADDGGGVPASHGCGGDDSTTIRVKVKVNPVNDPPEVVAGSSIDVCEDAGPVTVPGWATIRDEEGGTLTVVSSVSEPTLFAVQPSLSPTGVLSFTPAPDAYGSAEVTFAVTDALGATTTTPSRTITLKPANDPPQFSVLNDRVTAPACGSGESNPCTHTTPLPVVSPPTAVEAGQSVTSITVTPDPRFTNLFASVPIVDAGTGRVTFRLNPGEDTGGAFIPMTVTVADDGVSGQGCTGVGTFADDFLLKVTEDERQPTYTRGSDVTVVEDSRRYMEVMWAVGIDYGTGGVGLPVFRCDAVDQELVGVGGVTVDPVSGDLSFTPAPDRYGATDVTCTLDNGSGGGSCCGSDTFLLTVLPKNDPPSFTLSAPSITITDTAGTQTIASLIQSQFPGPYEDTQTISYVVTPADIEYLEGHATPSSSRRASVDPTTGDLTLTPIPGKTGTTTLSIYAVDSGGTARQGDDTSAPQQVVLNVIKGNLVPSAVCGGSVVVAEDTCMATAGGETTTISAKWATYVTSGDATEDQTQHLTAVFSNYNQAAFSVQPQLSLPQPPRSGGVDSTADLRYCAARDFAGVVQLTLTLEDDQGSASTPCVFSIEVSEVNDPPVVDVSDARVVSAEDSGAVLVANWVAVAPGSPAEQTQTTRVWVELDETAGALFASLPSVTASGGLMYTPAPDAYGVAPAQVCAEDNGGGDDTTCVGFEIEITPVNDAPRFDVDRQEVSLPEDSPVQRITDFVYSLTTGPSNEALQRLVSMTAEVDASELFEVPPEVSMATGDLVFGLKQDVYGRFPVRLTLRDDGGVSNGGVDTSVQVVSIVVVPANDPPSFNLSRSSVQVLEDTGRHDVANLAVLVTPGAYETSQGVSFSVTITASSTPQNDPGFAVPPSMSPAGTLSFTLSDDQYGVYTLGVTATDTESATSTPVALVLEVLEVNDRPVSKITQTVVEVQQDSGVSAVSIASPASPGPANEVGQAVGYVVQAWDTDLLEGEVVLTNDGLLHLKPRGGKYGETQLQVHAKDDGGVANGGYDTSGTTVVVVKVREVPGAYGFETKGDVAVDEDTPSVVLGGHVYGVPEGSQLIITSSDESVTGPVRVINYDGTKGVADVVVEPPMDANGVATVTVTARRGEAEAVRVFTVTVRSINDRPIFTLSRGVVESAEDAGPVFVGGFIQITRADSGLTTDVHCTDEETLFAGLPTMANTTLMYTSLPDKFGSSDCVVTLRDEAGLESQQSFRIVVLPVNDPPTFTPLYLGVAVYDTTPTVKTWAHHVTPGSGETNVQTVLFDVSAPPERPQVLDNFFQHLPKVTTVDTTAVLEIYPRRGTTGEGLVAVKAIDSVNAVSPTVLLLIMVIDSTQAPNPAITLALSVPLNVLEAEGVDAWEASLAAEIYDGAGTVQVTQYSEVVGRAEVTLQLEGDTGLDGLNALLGLLTDPAREAVRSRLHLERVTEGTSDLPIRSATPTSPTVPTPCAEYLPSTCPLPRCVVVSGVCMVAAVTPPPPERDGDTSLSPYAVLAIVLAGVALLFILAAVVAWVVNKGPSQGQGAEQENVSEVDTVEPPAASGSGAPENPLSRTFPSQ